MVSGLGRCLYRCNFRNDEKDDVEEVLWSIVQEGLDRRFIIAILQRRGGGGGGGRRRGMGGMRKICGRASERVPGSSLAL